MLMIALLIASQAALPVTKNPAPEAEALGVKLAQTDTLRTMASLASAKEAGLVLQSQPNLSEEERQRLVSITFNAAELEVRRVLLSLGHYYAQFLTVEELHSLVTAQDTPAAKRMQAVTAGAIFTVSALDTKSAVTAALCHENRKFCSATK